MFTDGLVERRGVHLDERLAQLESSLRASPSTEPGRVADFVIDAMTADDHGAPTTSSCSPPVAGSPAPPPAEQLDHDRVGAEPVAGTGQVARAS